MSLTDLYLVNPNLEQATQENVTLRGADILRRVMSAASASIDPDERRIARIMRDQFDEFIEGLGAGDVITGDPAIATQALRTGRNLWSRMRKGEMLENLIDRARNRSAYPGPADRRR